MQNKNKSWDALKLSGPKNDIEVAISFLSEGLLGVENDNQDTLLYFNQTNKSNIETILKSKTKLKNWDWIQIKIEDWNKNWKPFFKNININDEIEIMPSWGEKEYNVDKFTIKINPGMAFGTGHHETTELMIRSFLKYYENYSSVLDLGTGSGILSIIAGKLGLKNITAIDNDINVKDNFLENSKLNNVDLNILIEDCLELDNYDYDIVIANIDKNVLLKLLPKLIFCNGIIILSGLLITDFNAINDVIDKYNFNIIEKNNKNEWLCLVIGLN